MSGPAGACAVLFDLDGTLIRSEGTPDVFAEVAGRVFRSPTGPLDFRPDGMTDPEILARLLAMPATGAPPPTPRLLARFEVEWARALRAALAEGRVRIEALPGAREVVTVLASRPGCHLAVVTGNLRSSARVKLAAAGLDDLLPHGAYGSDAPSRTALPGRALERLTRGAGVALAAADGVIVGDTPHDHAAARASGMRSVLVASGSYTRGELAQLAPDALLDALADHAGAVRAILGDRAGALEPDAAAARPAA